MAEVEQPPIKEGELNYRILVLNFTPEGNPQLRIGQLMYGGRKTGHLLTNTLNAPSYKDMNEKLDREMKADESFQISDLFPEDPEVYAGIIITGSPFASYPRTLTNEERSQKKPYLTRWKRETINFIRKAVRAGVPVLGICFGAQAIAEALGGETEEMKNKEGKKPWEWGWRLVRKAPGSSDDPLLKNLSWEFVVAQNHHDCISRLPPRGVLLLENEFGIQGFRIDDPEGRSIAGGFQFHPERDPEEINKYLRFLLEDGFQSEGLRRDDFLRECSLKKEKFEKWLERHGITEKENGDLREILLQLRRLVRAGMSLEDFKAMAERGNQYNPQLMEEILGNFLAIARRRKT